MSKQAKIKQFKNEVEQYLKSQGIDLSYEQALMELAKAGGTVELDNYRLNEIDSALMSSDSEIDNWLDQEWARACKLVEQQ